MSVTVRPLGMLKDYVQGQKECQVEAGRSIRQTLAELGIPPELVARVLVNEEQQPKAYVLQDGDLLKLMAVIGGG